uniref:Exocyst complex component Sec10-like alpha-helical bundle domain-containing protein n=1 Tax=Compsopogon caeruleus TaxID=31354 RepID=A0A7S1TDD1_9RHOD
MEKGLGLSTFELTDFGGGEFDPHEFVECAVREDGVGAAASPTMSTKLSGAESFNARELMERMELLDVGLRDLRQKAVMRENEARDALAKALADTARERGRFAERIATLKEELFQEETRVDQEIGTLASIMNPIRVASQERACLQDARDVTAMMSGRGDGMDLRRAARLLSKLETVVREGQGRHQDGQGDDAMGVALKLIERWTLDLENTIENLFFSFEADEDMEYDQRAEKMLQCSSAAIELNGGASLIRKYVSSRPTFLTPERAVPVISSTADDPDGKECVETVNEMRRKAMDMIRNELPLVEVAFPEPAMIVSSLIEQLLRHKVALTAESILSALEEHAILAEMTVAVNATSEHTEYSSSAGVRRKRHLNPISANEAMLKQTASQKRRRYLCSLAGSVKVLDGTVHDMVKFLDKFDNVSLDLREIARNTIKPRIDGFLFLECQWLETVILIEFKDALDSPKFQLRSAPVEATSIAKYRSYVSRLAKFSSAAQRAISFCIESLERNSYITTDTHASSNSESLLLCFLECVTSICEYTLEHCINVLPKTEKNASKPDFWTQGTSPVALYAAAVEQISRAMAEVDLFISYASDEEKRKWPTPLLSDSVANTGKVELRSSMSRLEPAIETGLELAAVAVASRILRILEKEQKKPSDYSIGEAEALSIGGHANLLVAASFDDEEVTTGFAKSSVFLEQQVEGLSSSLTGRNLEYACVLMAITVRLAVLSYWQRLRSPVTPVGALRLMRDATAIQRCFRVCEVAETELAILTDIGNLFVLPPSKIWTLIEDGALVRLEGQLLAKLLELRPDFKSAKLKKLTSALAPEHDSSSRTPLRGRQYFDVAKGSSLEEATVTQESNSPSETNKKVFFA